MLERVRIFVMCSYAVICFFFFQAEDGIRDYKVTGVQTCALPISARSRTGRAGRRGTDDDSAPRADRGRSGGAQSGRVAARWGLLVGLRCGFARRDRKSVV